MDHFGQDNNNSQNNNNQREDNSFYTYGKPYESERENAYYTSYQEPDKPKKKKNGFAGKLAKGLALGLVFGLVAGTAFTGTTYFFGTYLGKDSGIDSKEESSGADLNISKDVEEDTKGSGSSAEGESQIGTVMNVSGIVDEVMPSIVSITTMGVTEVRNLFGQRQQYQSESCGSGIIISQDDDNLYIATNNHVVANAETLTILFSDDTTVSAQVKGTDPSTDLAVLSVSLDSLDADTISVIRTATFGDSDSLKVGETAVAIGNALGYGQSVTTGVISATNREVTVADETTGEAITNELLQTDAAINPGNSGGALLNRKGEVIGINSVKYSDTNVEGMGYAIPVSLAVPIVKQLITREEVAPSETPYLGISGVDVSPDVSSTYNMPKGVYVARVNEGTAAANAGITQGDIITKFDGRNISSMEEMQELMKYYKAGTTIEVTIQRAVNGQYEESTVNITLGSKK